MTTDAPSVILFFIDGLGVGSRGPFNPFDNLDDASPLALFKDETTDTFGGVLIPTDPRLGVDGRPQSASGQTTILTGVNAPSLLGYHKQGFPNQALLDVIREHSIFLKLKRAGVGPITFANAYTQRFFVERPRWVSATTAAVQAAGMEFRNVDDLLSQRAVYQDFTNRLLIERGEAVVARTAVEAAKILTDIAAANRFTLYEYFITDKVGHAQDMNAARIILKELALFIRTLISNIDLRCFTVIVTSDHGNIEDLSTRNHTLNDVPTIVWGADRDLLAQRIRTLADITPAIVEVLTRRGTQTDGNNRHADAASA
ncbi:MAG TPA: alkaline phosphatase family protein [Pyrinomonadaceae bacterium]|nr:alkaline phosphatase family protein [Pyrinomonadaceae bacterium]